MDNKKIFPSEIKIGTEMGDGFGDWRWRWLYPSPPQPVPTETHLETRLSFLDLQLYWIQILTGYQQNQLDNNWLINPLRLDEIIEKNGPKEGEELKGLVVDEKELLELSLSLPRVTVVKKSSSINRTVLCLDLNKLWDFRIVYGISGS
ncbi:hypothetical protein RHMOL_Rhmol07G0287800 [Rhododendron molle]|uniref:Uncharacterized protein n=1 Tax=Rhododendron molle TaxID=49168 RepID=A0ACC0N7R3_RHOML|nr:hypothetical protein RHMOL_Rhmol07G0287800 [Rhododendron molle]